MTRVVFLGTPAFAVPALRALAASPDIQIPLVITQPDRPAGRGQRLAASAIALAAEELGLPLLKPQTLRDPNALERLRAARPDVVLVVAYGELLRRAVLEAAPHGALNIHPSLLPRYRGAAPIPAAILHGDAMTGVSVIRLIRRLDAGPLVAQVKMDITAGDTTATLSERLAARSAELIPDVLRAYVAGQLPPRDQDEEAASYTREWTKDDARVDWSQPAYDIERLTRAAQPWPIAWTTLAGERLQLLRVAVVRDASLPRLAPGGVEMHAGLVLVRTGVGVIELRDVQPAGKRAMLAADWWRGSRRAEATFT